MKKKLLCSMLLLGTCAFSQPAVEWKKTLGGSQNEFGFSSCRTADGGYAVLSFATATDGDLAGNEPNGSAWLVKLDGEGNTVWNKTYGGSQPDRGYAIQATTDGGFVFVGNTYSNDGDVSGHHGGSDVWLVKLDATGDVQWQKCIGGTGEEYGSGIALATDGGYFICANSTSTDGDLPDSDTVNGDRWGIKTDSAGNIQWATRVDGDSEDTALYCAAAADGSFVVSGFSYSENLGVSTAYPDGMVTKFNADGSIAWNETYGGSFDDYLYGIVSLADGGFLIAGQTASFDGDLTENQGAIHMTTDAWALKIDTNGNVVHSESFGNLSDDSFISIAAAPDNGFVFLGESIYYDGGDFVGSHGIDDRDLLVAKFDANLGMQWYDLYGGTNSDGAGTCLFDSSGSLLAAAGTSSNDGDVSGNHGQQDLWVLKFEPEPLATKQFITKELTIFPNPSQSVLNILLPDGFEKAIMTVTDATGKTVQTLATARIDVAHLPAGIYFVEASALGQKLRGQFIKQ
ncbi:T9SS type A sorting domain-containing protein [Flavobacterium caeni]|uniref:Por secretion system C-terminal sorting domain-containing protein n=1 Tax=Flavobacterium caeni TaxID=490189 RepID=A0A1G5D7L6_9FLAO|nr:T9SS type A sorting domain-containing protein [Flavobacterium caeni]SCY10614.1 Por secretion system C-terminal sorting domain-containing protein [Flavobacterium caeni]